MTLGKNMNMRDQVRFAWKQAAEDLGFRITIPLALGSENQSLEADCFLPDFGGPKGAVFIAVSDFKKPTKDFSEAAKQGGYFLSVVNAEIYRNYSRETFIEALKDWGWFGPASEKPKWI